jgi:hypothetical protein
MNQAEHDEKKRELKKTRQAGAPTLARPLPALGQYLLQRSAEVAAFGRGGSVRPRSRRSAEVAALSRGRFLAVSRTLLRCEPVPDPTLAALRSLDRRSTGWGRLGGPTQEQARKGLVGGWVGGGVGGGPGRLSVLQP